MFGVRGSGFGVRGEGGNGARRRGSVLVLAMVLVAVLALVATAFIATVQIEGRASTNALRGLAAEAACRTALAEAVYRIDVSWGSCYRIDDPQGWHGYFHNASGPDLCTDEKTGAAWVEHYDSASSKHEMTAERFTLSPVTAGDPSAGHVKRLKRLRGFTAEYYAAVADLDGKLHANPKYFDNLLDLAGTKTMLNELGMVTVAVRDALADDESVNWSLGHLRKTLVNAGVPENDYEMNDVEKFFSAYPVVKTLDKATMGRPAVNVNTARERVLRAIVYNVPDLADKADEVAAKLVAARPFESRKQMEDALLKLGMQAWVPVDATRTEDIDTETKMNDLLNSLAGTNAETDSDLDRSGSPGIYSYDFDDDSNPPTRETTGEHTVDGAGPVSADYTWGTEVKFTSRFFHIYALGRTLAAAGGRTLSERRCHAIYDAQARRILWLRWNFGPKANMSD